MYFLSFIAIGSISLMIYNNNNNHIYYHAEIISNSIKFAKRTIRDGAEDMREGWVR